MTITDDEGTPTLTIANVTTSNENANLPQSLLVEFLHKQSLSLMQQQMVQPLQQQITLQLQAHLLSIQQKLRRLYRSRF